jgi:hypothetical protein
MMDKVITYAFLSVIKEKSGNITSLLYIFEELVESLLSDWVKKKLKGGRILDLQKDFKATYSIDIPIPTLRTILNNICQKNDSLLTTYQDDAFSINEYPDNNLSILLDKQQADVEAFYNLYNRYLHVRGLKCADYDLLAFFDQNKQYIIKCLNGETTIGENHQVQAQFIQKLLHLKHYNALINRIFLGSIISTYIELEIDDSLKNSKTLLLDTNFVVSLLNLHSEESFENCRMLMEIANKLKYKIEVMPFTIEETTALLNRVALHLNNVTYFQSLDKDSIYHGCFRNSINATGLTFIANKFVDKLREQYGILITDAGTNNSMIAEARQSEFYKNLKGRIHNPDGALHDATALYYTQKIRKTSPKSFKDINMWFVTDARGVSENSGIVYKTLPLVIRAEELLNILWLSHPAYDSNKFIKTTTSRLISSTLNIVPNVKMLKALDRKIQLIQDYPINAKDCIQIAEVIGSIENQRLKLIIEKNTQEETVRELKRLSAIAEEKEKEKEKEMEDILSIIKEDMQRSMERERKIIESIKNNELEAINIEARNEAANKEIELLEELIKRDQEELEPLTNDVILQIPAHAEKNIKIIFISLGIFCCIALLPLAFFIYKKWSFAEPILYLLTFIPWIITYFIGIIFSKKVSLGEIKKMLILKRENDMKKRKMNYIVRAELLEKRIMENKQKIKTIQDNMFFC